MSAIFTNLQSGQISDAPLLVGATTINSAAFANLPVVAAPDFLWVILDPEGADAGPEAVKVTAHSASATVVTVEREQQGTTAVEHPADTVWVAALTKDDLDKGLLFRVLTTTGDIAYASAANTAARLAIGTAGQALTPAGGVPTWGQVTAAGIASDAVTTAKILDSNVTNAKMADDSVDSAEIVDGAVDLVHLAAEVANRLTPAGTLRMTIFATEDDGWLNHDQTVVGAESSYPALWAGAPAAWKSGSDLVIPDLSDTAFIGAGTIADLGEVVGANTATLTEANLAPHDHAGAAHVHSIAHDHPETAATANGTYDLVAQSAYNGSAQAVAVEGTSLSAFNVDPSGVVTVNLPNYTGNSGAASFSGDTGSAGSGTAFSIVGKSVGVNIQIKAH